MLYSGHPTDASSRSNADYSPLRPSEDSNSSEHDDTRNAGSPRSLNHYERAAVDSGVDYDLEQPFLASDESPGLRGFHSLLLRLQCIPFVERNTGLLLVAFSQLFFALMHTSVKILNGLDPPISALEYLSLSDATVLTFLSPLSTALAGQFFLNEGFSQKEAAAGGVVLIARPQALFGETSNNISDDEVTSSQRLIAVGVALVGVLGATGVYTLLRAIGKRIHPLHSLMYFSSHCVLASVIGYTFYRLNLRIHLKQPFIDIDVFLTMGLQREAAGRGTLAIYIQIIFASILEQIFFHTVPSVLSVVGTLIILGSAIFVALTKKSEQPRPVETVDSGVESASVQAVSVELERSRLDAAG
ncbi:hypothetical protein EW145_g6261 [Phellinidium pouzarii]|uniref:EamA domain-containing protein n=1 Tax=Phellinidium pouzarii TaxID=167371 RepID=A0A4S4KYY0_9AGAM|nr:hypothetical protein EW145_g6261 [Phellinidium pouzarii]